MAKYETCTGTCMHEQRNIASEPHERRSHQHLGYKNDLTQTTDVEQHRYLRLRPTGQRLSYATASSHHPLQRLISNPTAFAMGGCTKTRVLSQHMQSAARLLLYCYLSLYPQETLKAHAGGIVAKAVAASYSSPVLEAILTTSGFSATLAIASVRYRLSNNVVYLLCMCNMLEPLSTGLNAFVSIEIQVFHRANDRDPKNLMCASLRDRFRKKMSVTASSYCACLPTRME
jgi:hypothetical protein